MLSDSRNGKLGLTTNLNINKHQEALIVLDYTKISKVSTIIIIMNIVSSANHPTISDCNFQEA